MQLSVRKFNIISLIGGEETRILRNFESVRL